MGSITWDAEIADVYDQTYAALFEPSVLSPMTGLFAELARGGPAVEFAVGTGRVALALSAYGIAVHGMEVIVPQLRRLPPGEVARVFTLEPDHVGIETFDDMAGQIAWSHHWIQVHGRVVRHSAPYRYVWPSELDLMAKIAGFRLRDRWAGWDRALFTSDSESQVAVFEKLP